MLVGVNHFDLAHSASRRDVHALGRRGALRRDRRQLVLGFATSRRKRAIAASPGSPFCCGRQLSARSRPSPYADRAAPSPFKLARPPRKRIQPRISLPGLTAKHLSRHLRAPLFRSSSVVEQAAVNRLVAGSNPAFGAKPTAKQLGRSARSQGHLILGFFCFRPDFRGLCRTRPRGRGIGPSAFWASARPPPMPNLTWSSLFLAFGERGTESV